MTATGGAVGKSAAAKGVQNRLGGHLRSKSGWYKAIAVCPGGNDWDEAEVAWLEAQLYRLLWNSTNVTMTNSQEPGEGRLSEVRQMRVANVTQAVASVLALVGHPVSTGSEVQERATRRQGGRSGGRKSGKLVTIKDLLDAGLLDAGVTLVSTKPTRWDVSVLVQDDGHLLTESGERYWSPSGASRALSDDLARQGWGFWKLPDGRTLSDLREAFEQRRDTG